MIPKNNLKEALLAAIKNAGKGSMNGKPTWHFRWDDVEILTKILDDKTDEPTI